MRLRCLKKPATASLVMAVIALSASCSLRQSAIEPSDYGFTGFLDPHVFQALVTAKPDSHTRGLVNQRDSAYFTAAGNARDKALQDLALYLISETAGTVAGAAEQNRKKFLAPLIAGLKESAISIKPAFEYYLEDNSAVLGYRIYQIDLKKNGTALLKKIIDSQKTDGADNHEKKQ